MVQMSPADQAVVKALPGNTQCCDCGMKNPQWASVSFGNVFCLECSGVHRYAVVVVSSVVLGTCTADLCYVVLCGIVVCMGSCRLWVVVLELTKLCTHTYIFTYMISYLHHQSINTINRPTTTHPDLSVCTLVLFVPLPWTRGRKSNLLS